MEITTLGPPALCRGRLGRRFIAPDSRVGAEVSLAERKKPSQAGQ